MFHTFSIPISCVTILVSHALSQGRLGGDLTISPTKDKQGRKQSPMQKALPTIDNPQSVRLPWDVSKELERAPTE